MLGKKQPPRQMKPLMGSQSPEKKVQRKGELLGSPPGRSCDKARDGDHSNGYREDFPRKSCLSDF